MEWKYSIRHGLKLALFLCFCVALGNAIRQVLAMETVITIDYELSTPIPAMTVCDYPRGRVNDTSHTLVQFLKAKNTLHHSNVRAMYVKANTGLRDRIADMAKSKNVSFEKLPLRTIVTVLNGRLAKCVQVERTVNQELDSKVGIVRTITVLTEVLFPS